MPSTCLPILGKGKGSVARDSREIIADIGYRIPAGMPNIRAGTLQLLCGMSRNPSLIQFGTKETVPCGGGILLNF